jgi:hypothetical protein
MVDSDSVSTMTEGASAPFVSLRSTLPPQAGEEKSKEAAA